MKKDTYSAVYLTGHPGRVIYKNRPEGNLIGELPSGTRIYRDDPGTITRDGGDPFECARFITPSGRIIEVKRD